MKILSPERQNGTQTWFSGTLAGMGGLVCIFSVLFSSEAEAGSYVKKQDWAETMIASRQMLAQAPGKTGITEILNGLEADFPMQWDWLLQDSGAKGEQWLKKETIAGITIASLNHILQELGDRGQSLRTQVNQLTAANTPPGDRRWLELYQEACQARRGLRLEALPPSARHIVFTRHHNLGGSHYAYTEGQSDAQSERSFVPGSSLCLLDIVGSNVVTRTLLNDDHGVIRDPAVSLDGKRVLFAWKKSDLQDDYHLYEMEVASGALRQLTQGLGFADYEAAYLPDGGIVFNSTRCVQTVDCWWTEVSNLYTVDKDGHNLRRLTFDQVHDNYPTILDDGRLIYTRWEYNDRGQIFPQPLYQMNSDGTGQAAFYGNSSWFPTSILHARGIPGSQKVIAIASGHHSMQAGKLILIDPSKGREEATGVCLIAPVRETKPERIDAYGQEGDLFQYPYPLNEDFCLVSYHPTGWANNPNRFLGPKFKLYLMASDGRRELLAADPSNSCNQPVALCARPASHQRASLVDYRKDTGTYFMQDIYGGDALPGITRGTIKNLRIVTLDFRAAGVGDNGSSGPAGGALSSTPVSISNGSWDPKIVLGDATVYEDGSAFFQAPARVPLYFQALDEKGRVVQTMRSWSTLQPGENASCIGCHDDKNASSLGSGKATRAATAGAQPLKPFYGPARPFSFSTEIQPILNRNCITCHNNRSAARSEHDSKKRKAFSLLGTLNNDAAAGRQWSDAYLALTSRGKMSDIVNWIGVQSIPSILPPYFAGSAKSSLMTLLEKGHGHTSLTREELDLIACWIDLLVPYCGDYREATLWSAEGVQKYDHFLQKRRRMQEMELAQKTDSQAVRIELVDGTGRVVTSDRPFLPGDRIKVFGPARMMVRLSPELPECLVYSPEGRIEFPIPVGTDSAKAYPPSAFSGGKSGCTARPATEAEIAENRNLALNPWDIRGWSSFFPHATSNSECRKEPVFAARNAIDGSTHNVQHGAWPNQSWGPDQRTDIWWKLDFGRSVQINKLVLSIRADFPHDQAWQSATLSFSDGSTQKIEIRKTRDPQTFSIDNKTVSWIQLDGLIQAMPLGWCALSEVEVYGHDIAPRLLVSLQQGPK